MVRRRNDGTRWWEAEDGKVHASVKQHLIDVETNQSDLFSRLEKLAFLYDPCSLSGLDDSKRSQVTENVCASNVDSITAQVTMNEVRARLMTDDADWSTQRRARHLEWYSDGLSKKLKLRAVAGRQFKESAIKGVGCGFVYADKHGKCIIAEHVLVDDVIVDNREVRTSSQLPRQIHLRRVMDRDDLKARFPDSEDEIENASGISPFDSDIDLHTNDVITVWSWKRPIGVKGAKGYKPGCFAITIADCDLLVEPYEKNHFPISRLAWEERETGWYAIGLIERIAGHQRAINKLNWQEDRQIDQHAVPTTYCDWVDRNMTVKSIGRGGTIIPVKGRTPETVIPKAVGADQKSRRFELKESAFEETGNNRLMATGMKPGGIDSGVGLREYRDQSSQRNAKQEKAFENCVLELHWLALDAAKDLGNDAPIIVSKAKRGVNKIKWSEVDMGEVEVQLAAASTLSKTPAGRVQLALEWAQAGVISQDEARRLMRHPDTERSMSLYTAALEDIERCIETVLDGEHLVPEPYQNLKMGIWRFQQAYLKACDDAVPEGLKEALRDWIVQAAWLDSQASAGAAPGADMGAEAQLGQAAPMDAAMAAGPPIGVDPGAAMTGAGVTAANLLQ